MLLFTLPFTILGNIWGFGLGFMLAFLFLLAIYWRAEEKLSNRLGLVPISLAEEPEIHHTIKELSRRIGIVSPRLAKLRSEALNIGVFGLSNSRTTLIFTEGLLKTLSRSELCALIGRELTAVSYGDAFLSTWFSSFLNAIEVLSLSTKGSPYPHKKGNYSMNWVVRQMVFLPIAMVPQYLLLGIRKNINLDEVSLKLTKLPTALDESFRLLEAMAPRNTLKAPLSTAPLFLLPPVTMEPLSRLLFSYATPKRTFSKSLNSLTQQGLKT